MGQPDFTPLSFRAGNWLFQPSRHAAAVLAQNGIRLDSSVFKGGLQHNHGLDYRRTMRHGYHWNFVSDVTVPDATGEWFEVPIYTEMVPVWRMSTSKRMAFNRRKAPASPMAPPKDAATKWNRMRDFMRWRYPLKLDFCRMTMDELVAMTGRIIQADRADPATYRPIVAIGHTKDLTDPHTVDEFLSFLGASGIPVVTFKDVIGKLAQQRAALGALVAVEI